MERDSIERRNRALFKNYIRIIKSYGEYAKYIPKGQLYEETGKPFFVGKRTVYQIISNMMKNRDNVGLPEEIEEDLHLVLSVYEG